MQLASTLYECSTGDKERQHLRYRQRYLYILRCDWRVGIRIAHYQSIRVGARTQSGAVRRHINKRTCFWRECATWNIDQEPGGQRLRQRPVEGSRTCIGNRE
jgi:hypothetical protein